MRHLAGLNKWSIQDADKELCGYERGKEEIAKSPRLYEN
jgi:hypothetical protein